jgi:hypothetical protein
MAEDKECVMISKSRYRPRWWSPTREQAEFLKAIEPTRGFLDNLPAEVRKRYAGQWIAVRDSTIVAAAPTCADLYETLGESDDPSIFKVRIESGITIRWRRHL